MSLATLTSKDLSRIQKLIERKEALALQVVEIDSALEGIESSGSGPGSATSTIPTKGRAAAARSMTPMTKAKTRKSRRGDLKKKITAELRAAGSQGRKVKDLAARIGTSYGNVTAFFQSTGKKIKDIKKVGPAQFAWVGV